MISDTNTVIGDEQSRLLRTRLLLSENDQEALGARLEDATRNIERSADTDSGVRKQLKQLQSDLSRTENLYRSSLREIDNLRVYHLLCVLNGTLKLTSFLVSTCLSK